MRVWGCDWCDKRDCEQAFACAEGFYGICADLNKGGNYDRDESKQYTGTYEVSFTGMGAKGKTDCVEGDSAKTAWIRYPRDNGEVCEGVF